MNYYCFIANQLAEREQFVMRRHFPVLFPLNMMFYCCLGSMAYYCAPCERRLNNAIQFKKIKTETRKALAEKARTKRCVDISPTVERPTKVRTAGTGSSRPTRHRL